MWYSHVVGSILCIALILLGSAVNIYLTDKYNLTIGLVDTNNFFLLQSIISKPWTKFGNIGIAGILACLYYRLLKYRQLNNVKEQKAKYYITHKFVTSGSLGAALSLIGGSLVVTNLLITWPANSDPAGTSHALNVWYYAVSRSSFVLGIAMMIWSIFLGHAPYTKALLSCKLLRIVARSVVIGCVLEVVVIELLYCSDTIPQGMYITMPIALILGVGFKFVTPLLSILITIALEFPLTRVIQLTILPYISHDRLVESYHNQKTQEKNFETNSLDNDQINSGSIKE